MNPSSCDCECDKTCKIGEYLDINNVTWIRLVVDNLAITCEYESLDFKTCSSALPTQAEAAADQINDVC